MDFNIDVSLTTEHGYNLRDHAVHVGYLAIAHCHIAFLASDTLLAVKLLVVLSYLVLTLIRTIHCLSAHRRCLSATFFA